MLTKVNNTYVLIDVRAYGTNQAPIFSAEVLREYSDGAIEVEKKLMHIYEQDVVQQLRDLEQVFKQKLDQTFQQQQTDIVLRHVQDIRTSSSYFGARRVCEMSLQMEKICSHFSVTRARPLFYWLQYEVQQLRTAIHLHLYR